MKMVLSEAEVTMAVKRYAEAKMPVTAGWEITVKMLWRGHSAVVEVVRTPVPTLTDAVGGPGCRATSNVEEDLGHGIP